MTIWAVATRWEPPVWTRFTATQDKPPCGWWGTAGTGMQDVRRGREAGPPHLYTSSAPLLQMWECASCCRLQIQLGNQCLEFISAVWFYSS